MKFPTFRFGRNWQSFNENYLNEERIGLAKKSLQDFLGVESLEGKTFADVGAGSGIDSIAALDLGASDVFSFDADDDCVKCCEDLKKQRGNPSNWHIARGSATDGAFMSAQKQYDIVYSWGVLHHTGDMWNAIENTMKLVKPGGVFFLAIYNKVDDVYGFYKDGRFGTSKFWLREKKFYVSMPAFIQNLIDYCVMAALVVLYVLMLKNPVKEITGHKYYFNKGMPWRINIKDWLGGYPYETATVAEIFHFARKRGFSLENLTSNNGLLNNEFLLKKRES